MFYSKTFLAKKSSLGTVWIAAHLQNRLRKSHVVLTDISYTIDQIMLPEAPMALRLSGHLLLGVVRIYSKKVDYLYHDCNEFAAQIRMLFKPVTVNLPEDANCASFHSITLPDTFDLDALEFDDTINLSVSDDHRKTLEDITLPDQTPVEGDAYISIHLFGLQGSAQSSPQPRRQSVASVPMEEDVLPPFSADVGIEINSTYSKPKDASALAEEPTPTNQLERSSPITTTNSFPEISPGFEIMRDAVHNVVPEILPEFGEVGESLFQEENFDDRLARKEIISPIRQSLSISEEDSPRSRLARPNVVSPDVHEMPSFGIFPGKSFPELSVKSSPPLEKKVNQQKLKKRKRIRFFDEVLVLTNTDIKNQLEDTSMLVHKRRKVPSSSLDLWKSRRRFQDTEIFQMPLISGMCEQLIGAYNITFPVTTTDSLHLDPIEVTNSQSCGRQSPVDDLNQDNQNSIGGISDQLPVRQTLIDDDSHQSIRDIREISEEFLVGKPQLDGGNNQDLQDATEVISEQYPVEHPRFDGTYDQNVSEMIEDTSVQFPLDLLPFGGDAEENLHPDLPFSPDGEDPMTFFSHKFDTASRNESALRTDTMSKNSDASYLRSPLVETSLGDEVSLFGRSILPASPDDDDLIFLEEDGTPTSSKQSLACNVSGRTRAVALYLKEQSPGTQRTTNHLGDLCLNRILDGKTKKQCARMFFETLILKSYDIIDVQQPEAYGDITVSLNPTAPKIWL